MSPASILANNESNAPDATSSSTASRPLTRSDRALSSATRSILILSDGPAAYTKDLTPPLCPGDGHPAATKASTQLLPSLRVRDGPRVLAARRFRVASDRGGHRNDLPGSR